MSKPLISFVCPTYNRVAWIAECVQSLRNQTEKDIEIIIVDDCSKDRTMDVLDFLKKQDARIIVHRNKENQGAGISRNIGNRIATADIIAVCDSDDYYTADRATVLLNAFKSLKIDMVNTGYHRVNYSNHITETYPGDKFDKESFLSGKSFYFCHPSAAYRRKDALLVPYKRETKSLTDDRMFVGDWIKTGRNIELIENQVTCFHRVLPGSIMTEMRGGSLE